MKFISSVTFILVLLTAEKVLGGLIYTTGEILCNEEKLVQKKEQDGSVQRKYESYPPRECKSTSDCPVDYCSIFAKHDDAPMELACQKQIRDKSTSNKSCQCYVLRTPSYSSYSTECYPKTFSLDPAKKPFELPSTDPKSIETISISEYWVGSPGPSFRGIEIEMGNSTCSNPSDQFVPNEKGVFFTTDFSAIYCRTVDDCPADYCQTIGAKIADEYEVATDKFNSADKFNLRCMRKSNMSLRCTCALIQSEHEKCPKSRPGIFKLEMIY